MYLYKTFRDKKTYQLAIYKTVASILSKKTEFVSTETLTSNVSCLKILRFETMKGFELEFSLM